LVILIFPAEGTKFLNFELNFLSKSDFSRKNLNLNASPVIEVNSDSISKLEDYRRDSIRNIEEKRLKLFKDSVLIAEKKIQYPNNDRSILFPFFNSLQNAKNGKVRIMHYGDSQIEADRISGRLRERLQRDFGGCGSGAYAVIPATRKISIRNKVSTNWKRFTGFGPYIDTSIMHKNYGALFSFCKISPDTNVIDTSSICNGLVKIFRPKKGYKHCRNYQQINFYYSSKENINIKYVINDTIFYNEVWDSSYKIKKQTINFSEAPESFEAHFKSKISPLIYGISTEGTNGVVVDNIPLRGASGTEFGRIDFNGLKNMHELLSPNLFILEFGGNAIAHIKTKSRAQRYGNYFKRQINKLKKINPNAIVLLIGPGDMAKKENTQLISYPMLEEVRDELKKVAFETNSCFWDMYLNMGGKNSIIEWANQSPSLAAKDYIHLTNAGARKVADFFIEDIMNDFDDYLANKK